APRRPRGGGGRPRRAPLPRGPRLAHLRGNQRDPAAGDRRPAAGREDRTMTEPAPSAHLDLFCRESLPPRELWPEMSYATLPELAGRARLNAATELLDSAVERGRGERTVFHFPGGTWTYRQLLETANRIAHVLVDDLGLIPGN